MALSAEAAILLVALLFQAPPTSRLRENGEPILGKPAEWSLDQEGLDRKTIEIEAGTPLLEEPWPEAAVVGEAPGGELVVWESRPGWVRVIWGELIGWVLLAPFERAPLLEAGTEAGDRITPKEPTVPRRRGVSPMRIALLEKAAELLGPGAVENVAGPFRLRSDGSDRKLIRHLGSVAAHLAETYRDLYGLEERPVDGVVVMFSHKRAYNELRELVDSSIGETAHGFELSGVAVLSLEGRGRQEVVRTVVHELTHVLNRRLLEPPRHPSLPAPLELIAPWLEEGLASNLGLSYVDPQGRLHPDILSRELIEIGGAPRISGAPAAIRTLDHGTRCQRVPTLSELTTQNRKKFFDDSDDRIVLKYLQSATFIRFLLADDELGPAFRSFLREVAAGSLDSSAILSLLPVDPDRLEAQYNGYVRALVAAQLSL